MQTSKLVNFIGLLSKNEIKAAKKFLESPYFNTDPQVTQLFLYITKRFPEFNHKSLDRQVAFKKIFLNEPFDYLKLRRLMSKLNKLLESFLAIETFQQDEREQNRQLIKAFTKRKNGYRHFKRTIENSLTKLYEQEDPKDAQYYDDIRWLNHQYYFHPSFEKYSGTSSHYFKNLLYGANHYIAHQMLEYDFSAKTRKKNLNETYLFPFSQPIIELFKQKKLDPGFLTLLVHIRSIEDQEYTKDDLNKVNAEYDILKNQLSHTEKNTVLLLLINLAIQKFNNQTEEFGTTLINLYKRLIEDELILKDGVISEANYLNIALTGAKVSQFYDWAYHFVNDYQKYLKEEVRSIAYYFVLSNLHYNKAFFSGEKKYYVEALRLLPPETHSRLDYKLRVRSLESRIYYDYHVIMEQNYLIAYNYLDAFREFLTRNKHLSIERKERHKTYIYFLKKLIDIVSVGRRKQEIQDLQKRILERENVAGKEWLIKKSEELKSSSF